MLRSFPFASNFFLSILEELQSDDCSYNHVSKDVNYLLIILYRVLFHVFFPFLLNRCDASQNLFLLLCIMLLQHVS